MRTDEGELTFVAMFHQRSSREVVIDSFPLSLFPASFVTEMIKGLTESLYESTGICLEWILSGSEFADYLVLLSDVLSKLHVFPIF